MPCISYFKKVQDFRFLNFIKTYFSEYYSRPNITRYEKTSSGKMFISYRVRSYYHNSQKDIELSHIVPEKDVHDCCQTRVER